MVNRSIKLLGMEIRGLMKCGKNVILIQLAATDRFIKDIRSYSPIIRKNGQEFKHSKVTQPTYSSTVMTRRSSRKRVRAFLRMMGE